MQTIYGNMYAWHIDNIPWMWVQSIYTKYKEKVIKIQKRTRNLCLQRFYCLKILKNKII